MCKDREYGLFSEIRGSLCFFCPGNFLRFYLSSQEISASFKICANEEETSSIISGYCYRRSVPVGVPTLCTIEIKNRNILKEKKRLLKAIIVCVNSHLSLI